MHRQQLLNLLENYIPTDTNELSMRNETIDFVKKNKDCFKRELLEGHITGSAWIVDITHQNVLLIHQESSLHRISKPLHSDCFLQSKCICLN